MKLTFDGAARTVTGSCHCVEANGKKFLVDCGLQQGREEVDNHALYFDPASIDYIIVTHAHIDHSGRIPLMAKQGFQGRIVTTRLTGELLSIMLRDSAHIQESDAMWETRRAERAGRPAVEPLYTVADAEAALQLIVPYEYGETVELCEGISLRFVDAGHLLGSASVELWITENGLKRKLLFSGDIGNMNQPIIRNPQYISEADYVIMESTYGDRIHEIPKSYTEALAALIEETFSKGGNVVIPAFAVGRTQELLYYIREIKDRGLVKSVPDFTVCVDSPLASEATNIFSGDLRGYMDEEAIELMRQGNKLFHFPGLRLVETSEESKALNTDPSSKVIISASGMCDAGRIRHHLKHNLWRPESVIVFVGYQAEGTLGRRLLDGAETVKLFGEEIAVRAGIVNFKGMSSHADRDHLLFWINHVNPRPTQVFVVHGESSVAQLFADTLQEKGFSAHAPLLCESWDLAAGRMLEAGAEPVFKKQKEAFGPSAEFRNLEETGRTLLQVIQHNRGGANKDLRKFTEQLKTLIQKWDR